MRRTVTIALGTAAALATAAVAFAVVPSMSGVSAATATFSTATIERSKLRSCTSADGKKWEFTQGQYRGTAVSTNTVLDGSLAINARTTYNATDGLGYVEGSFKIKDGDSRVKGTFSGTIKDGQLAGYLTGKSHGRHATVLGDLSAAFAGGATNFVGGTIGAGSPHVLAVVAGPVCKGEKSKEEKSKDEKGETGERAKVIEVKGQITALGGTPPSITVTGEKGTKTCAIDAKYAVPAGFVVGTKPVEMKCEAVGDPAAWTLRKLEKDD